VFRRSGGGIEALLKPHNSDDIAETLVEPLVCCRCVAAVQPLCSRSFTGIAPPINRRRFERESLIIDKSLAVGLR